MAPPTSYRIHTLASSLLLHCLLDTCYLLLGIDNPERPPFFWSPSFVGPVRPDLSSLLLFQTVCKKGVYFGRGHGRRRRMDKRTQGQGHDNMKQQHGRAGVGCRLRCAAEPSTDSERIHDHEYLLLSSLSIKKETRLLLYTGN